MKRVDVVVGVCLVAAAMGMVGAPATASACIHEDMVRQVNPTLRDVRRAERLLAAGKHQRAVRLARRAFDGLDQLPPEADAFVVDTTTVLDYDAAESGPQLFVRAQRVAALAAARSGGTVGPERGWKGTTEAERAQNLAWAAFVLQFHAGLQPDNTVLHAEYAEVAASVPLADSIAYAVLSRLHAEDLMPTARGYVLLAKLQRDRGDSRAAASSLVRCHEITGDDGQCDIA